jgi:hypothetical protein
MAQSLRLSPFSRPDFVTARCGRPFPSRSASTHLPFPHLDRLNIERGEFLAAQSAADQHWQDDVV